MKYYLIIPFLAGILLLVLYFVSCQEKNFEINDEYRQDRVLDRDQSAVPIPDTVVIIDSNNNHIMVIIEVTKDGDYILRKRVLASQPPSYQSERLLIDNLSFTIDSSNASFTQDCWFVPIDGSQPEKIARPGNELECFCEIQSGEDDLGNPCTGDGECQIWIRWWSRYPCEANECCAKCDARLCIGSKTILDPRGFVLSRKPRAILNEEQNSNGIWSVKSGLIHGDGMSINVNISNDTAYVTRYVDTQSEGLGGVYNLTNMKPQGDSFELEGNNRFWMIPFDPNIQCSSGGGEKWVCKPSQWEGCHYDCELRKAEKCLECRCTDLYGDCDLVKDVISGGAPTPCVLIEASVLVILN